jgi:hypothetical protein
MVGFGPNVPGNAGVLLDPLSFPVTAIAGSRRRGGPWVSPGSAVFLVHLYISKFRAKSYVPAIFFAKKFCSVIPYNTKN